MSPNSTSMQSTRLQMTLHYLSPTARPPFVSLYPSAATICQRFSPTAARIQSLPFCLNSLWTPNANSVRHLIRHINSISPLIALIPLCNEFLCDVPLVQQHQKQDKKKKKKKGIADRGLQIAFVLIDFVCRSEWVTCRGWFATEVACVVFRVSESACSHFISTALVHSHVLCLPVERYMWPTMWK